MIPPRIAGFDSDSTAGAPRHSGLSPERLIRVRSAFLGVTLFFGLVVYVFHTIALLPEREPLFLHKLRGIGILTWIYALVQMLDMRFYNSRFAQRRRASARIPDSLHGWLFGQMLACFGIVYYGLTEDLRWYVAGVAILALSFLVFPISGTSASSPP